MAVVSSYNSSFVGYLAALGRGNASLWLLITSLIFAAVAGLSSAAKVYNVGDQAGWIITGNYSTWASSKKFQIGDTIVFVYNKAFHDVLEVNKADYHSCNSASPIATHATGNDSIAITRYGHRFFICGFPGHCAAGQKVDIRVAKNPMAAAPSVELVPSAGVPASARSASPVLGPAQQKGGSAEIDVMGLREVVAAAAVAACAVFLVG
ncbi:hypothetical protein HPP92_007758 [Vanilla planifolia]|uniref:Phytocyanin domain-containing protein n=1 Tax=Vanilla planifolia TaxID=51239 RepID=A0A835REN3_VANPL|nr:hypothetical protein HPP92_007758 [Vanilla planifolia]